MSEWERLRSLLDGVGESELREICLDALREWHRTSNKHRFSVFADFAPLVVDRLAKRKGISLGGASLTNAFESSMQYPDMGAVLDFIWTLVHAGALIPMGGDDQSLPRNYHVTRAGRRVLAGNDVHALAPGFVRRVQERCPGVPDDVIALLADAVACFERGLGRPTVMLLGVAFESAVETVADALVSKQLLSAPVPHRAAQRLASVRAVIPARFPGSAGTAVEQRSAATQACDFADELRRRRNDGSHTKPRYPFDDRSEIEELIASAGRNLPHLWLMAG